MLDRPHDIFTQTVDGFKERLQAADAAGQEAIVNELARVTYPAKDAQFVQMPHAMQLPYLELLRDIAVGNQYGGIARNQAFTALNTASRYGIEGASPLADEAAKVLRTLMPVAKGKSVGEESQVVAAAVNGMHLADWLNAGRPEKVRAAKVDAGAVVPKVA